ncbi:hypothetical protein RM423_25130, partial [Jatrophihabitans sp. DSM 44399]|nr:hypothetical protein [Jatrophihabitans sp. DSM 44399]
RWLRTDAWDTGFVDLAGTQGLLGQVEGRTSACVVDWLQQRTPEFRPGIRFVAIDRPRSTPPRSERPVCCRTRRWSLITFMSTPWPTRL